MTRRNARALMGGMYRFSQRAAKRILAVPRAVRPGAVQAPRPRTVKMRLVFDGGNRLNWSTEEAAVDGLDWEADSGAEHGGHSVATRRGNGVQGFVDFPSSLQAGEVRLLANVGRERLRIVARKEPRDAKLSNTGINGSGSLLSLSKDGSGAAGVSVQDEANRAPYVRAVTVGLGTLHLEFGAVSPGTTVALRKRKSAQLMEVPEVARGDHSLTVELRRMQWAAMSDSEATSAVWDVLVSTPEGTMRPSWGGSQLAVPRESLRFVATSAVLDAERLMKVRPYWTKDQKLAVEIAEVLR